MAPNTRKFLIGSTLVVAVGLCTGLVAYWGGALPGRDTRPEFSYIPADVSAVAFADVRDIMDSEFREKLRQVMPAGKEKDRLFEETGINIDTDIDTVVAALSGNGPADAVVMFRGRFDRARIEAIATKNGAQPEQYGGKALLVGLTHAPGQPVAEHAAAAEHIPALAFLDDDLLALGDVNGVRKAIDVAAGTQDVTSNADLMRFISGVQGTGNAWLVGRAREITDQPNVPAQVKSQMDGLEWLSISADVDRDVRGLIRAEARDEAAGQQLRTVLAGALAAARMFGEQDARLALALNSVQTTGAGRNVELSFLVPAAMLDLVKPGAALPPPAPASPQ